MTPGHRIVAAVLAGKTGKGALDLGTSLQTPQREFVSESVLASACNDDSTMFCDYVIGSHGQLRHHVVLNYPSRPDGESPNYRYFFRASSRIPHIVHLR